MAGALVSLEAVRQVFASPGAAVEALGPLDLEIAAGELVAILGPSGCGKSTLLRLVAGLERPSAGRVRVDGAADGGRRGVAYVFQDAHLLPWRDVQGNVELPLELGGRPAAERRREATAAIAQVGLAEAAARYPAQLSGGMRMRASLARALVTRPRLFLLDEPFAALDEITRHELDDQLRALHRATGATVVFVTHSTTEAAYLAERAVVLTPRPGRLALDHRLGLPARRQPSLRAEAAFAHETGVLQRALGAGGGSLA